MGAAPIALTDRRCTQQAHRRPVSRPAALVESLVSIKTVCKHMPDLRVNGRCVGERHGRVRDDVRSAFALRGESENRSLVFSLLRLRRCRIQVPVSVAKGEYYPTCFAKHLLAQREVGRVCYGDAPFRDGTYLPCGNAHGFSRDNARTCTCKVNAHEAMLVRWKDVSKPDSCENR